MFDQCDDPPNLLCQQNKHRALKTVLNKTNLDKKNVLHLTEIQRYITLQKSWVWSKLDLSKKAKPGKEFFKTKKHQQLNNLKAKKYHQPKNVCIEFHLWTNVMSEKKPYCNIRWELIYILVFNFSGPTSIPNSAPPQPPTSVPRNVKDALNILNNSNNQAASKTNGDVDSTNNRKFSTEK